MSRAWGAPGLRLVTRQKGLLQRALSCKKLSPAKSCLQIPTCQNIIPFLQDHGQRSVFCNFFILTKGTVFLEWKMSAWVCSISLLTILVAHLHMQAEQATIILMSTKIYIIMINSVNPILLRPVLGIVLAIDSVLLKVEQLMSWLQSSHHAVSFSPLVAVIVSVK